MFWDNLLTACDAYGVKVTPLLQELNISTGNIGRWKRGGDVKSDVLVKLSKKLEVSTDFLLTGQASQPAKSSAFECTTKDEQDLLMMYRSLPLQLRTLAFNYLKSSYDTYNVLVDNNSKSAV